MYAALLSAPLASSLVVRALLQLRSLPSRLLSGTLGNVGSTYVTLGDTIRSGFFLVDEQPGREMVLGAVGRFWKMRGGMKCGATIEDLDPIPPGNAAALWNFRVVRNGNGSTLHTETRIRCADAASRRSFRRYWFVVRPFSALIRREMLRSIKRFAEEEAD